WKRYSMRVSKNWVKFNKMFTLSPWGEYQGETGTGGVAGGFSVYKMPPLWYIEEKSSSTAHVQNLKRQAN
ncbi:hypothetical protein, partial [Aeromonas rivipollensis]|uniref:hypothetical protein n=1 Tax=Aeromonas rivipollensis TaxID=948519 RepID=UPI003D203EF8